MRSSVKKPFGAKAASDTFDSNEHSVLPCIRNRRSIFPKDFRKNAPPLDPAIAQSLLDAALWAPYHGRCYKDQEHPARFVSLGKQSLREMQNITLTYYDKNWRDSWEKEEDYKNWRQTTEEEIEGRWGPCDYMIAIVMRRFTGPRKFPEWEQAAAVAAAVQNMHLQSTKYPHLACYWSSWHDKARDSVEMKQFLGMESEDKCHGFFIVAQAKNPNVKDRRKRDRSLMAQEWRP
ncbi:MAG: hypothetical protein SGILL_008190 [Bacillariaceae sp.]